MTRCAYQPPNAVVTSSICDPSTSRYNLPTLKPFSARPMITSRVSLYSEAATSIVSPKVSIQCFGTLLSASALGSTLLTTAMVSVLPDFVAASFPSVYSGGSVYYYNSLIATHQLFNHCVTTFNSSEHNRRY